MFSNLYLLRETIPQCFDMKLIWKSEQLPLAGAFSKPATQMMTKHDVIVVCLFAGYPPLQPASFKPQTTRRQGIVAVHYQVKVHASAGFAIPPHRCKKNNKKRKSCE